MRPDQRRAQPRATTSTDAAKAAAKPGNGKPRNYVQGSTAKPLGAEQLAELRVELLAGAAVLGVPLDDRAADRLLQYLELLRRWNSVYNLTAIHQPREALVHHLLDSLAVVAPLLRQLGRTTADAAAPAAAAVPSALAAAVRLLDVGSGGGLPGVVLAVALPWLQVHCVDTVGKKATFIRQVGAELGLSNLQSHHARVEDLRLPAFDVITSRAFASLADFVELTRTLLAPQATWMAMKGQHPAEEIAALPPGVAQVFHVESLTVPGDPGERCIVWLRHAAPTPNS
ncbi:MAG: Ribosomal small subunit methyltransferase [Pseudomonadota bacterium]|jgi:16S rRNA (guanine527-N7)-methyltransferase